MGAAPFVSAIFGLAVLPGAALAESTGCPGADKAKAEYLTMQELRNRVVEQGYQIRSGEIGKGCGEFYAIDKNGKRAELSVDPSGKIIVVAG